MKIPRLSRLHLLGYINRRNNSTEDFVAKNFQPLLSFVFGADTVQDKPRKFSAHGTPRAHFLFPSTQIYPLPNDAQTEKQVRFSHPMT